MPDDADRRGSRFDMTLSALRHELMAGRFRDADMLPSERDLSDLLSVSRTTLRRALAELVDEEVLTQRQGVGTFIKRKPPVARGRRPGSVPDFDELMRMQGRVPSHREIERAMVRPTAEDAMILACSPDDRVLRLARLHCADREPVALERAVVPAIIMDVSSRLDGSVREALALAGFRPSRVLEKVQATLAGDEEAMRLEVARGSAALSLTWAFYLPEGRCCLLSRWLFRADRYELFRELNDLG